MIKQINLSTIYSRYVLLALLLFSLQSKIVAQGNYYVSSSIGDNAYDGLAPEWDGTHGPWKTISKVNSQSLSAGNSILLKRGDIWNEQLTVHNSGSSGSPITYRAYGTGDNPLISGADIISNWVLHNAANNVWVDTVSTAITKVSQVFVDGSPYTLARWPNSGWNTVDSTLAGGKNLYDTSLTQSEGYWSGATLVIRSCMWDFNARTITASSGSSNTISWETALQYSLNAMKDYGYYIENKLDELDNAGEYYFDATNHLLYIALPSGETPSNHLIEASVRDYGIKADSRSYISISNINIQKAALYGIYANYNNYWSIKNCNISYCKKAGISCYAPGNTSMEIQGNTISHIDEGDGISVNNISYTSIVGNTIEYIASDSISPQDGKGIILGGTSTNSTIKGNIIRYTSGHGIYSSSTCSPVNISNNILSRCVIQLQDNGGIYISGNQTGTVVEYNRIDDCPGNYQGTPYSSGTGSVVGLYLDEYSSHSVCRYNIVSGCAYGTLLHKASESTLLNNTFYNNRVASICLSEKATNQMYGNVVKNNLCYAADSTQMTLKVNRYPSSDSTSFVGTFDNNLYYNPDRDDHIQYLKPASWTSYYYYTLAEWQAKTGRDAGNDSLSIALDPLLEDVANGDFHLTSLSPCIDSGVDVGLTQDFDSIPVPQGTNPDIGAYESQSGSSAEFIWTGNVSTNWEDGGNWNLGSVPLAASNVTIPAATNKPVANRLTTSGKLSIAPGGVLTVTDEAVSDNENSPQSLPVWGPEQTNKQTNKLCTYKQREYYYSI